MITSRTTTSIKRFTRTYVLLIVSFIGIISFGQLINCDDESQCSRIIKDVERLRTQTKVNNRNAKPLLMQIVMVADNDRKEIAKKCERICKDCPHEGGKMCNCDNYTMDHTDEKIQDYTDNTDPGYDEFELGDLDANVEEKPNFYRSNKHLK